MGSERRSDFPLTRAAYHWLRELDHSLKTGKAEPTIPTRELSQLLLGHYVRLGGGRIAVTGKGRLALQMAPPAAAAHDQGAAGVLGVPGVY